MFNLDVSFLALAWNIVFENLRDFANAIIDPFVCINLSHPMSSYGDCWLTYEKWFSINIRIEFIMRHYQPCFEL